MEDTFITQITIENVRHLYDITIPLSKTESKHLIITGKNGSGKTSLLEAIKYNLSAHINNYFNEDYYQNKLMLVNRMVKIERSQPAPASLEREKLIKSGKYDKEDVIERLVNDFNNKRYICEMKELQDPNVEHLHSHKGDVDKKFDWSNLFWSCSHCNGVKNRDKYDDKIIDCTVIDPEEYIYFRIEGSSVRACIKQNTDESKMTCELINDVLLNNY